MSTEETMSPEEEEWDLQAAEYVLGTLHDENQRVFDALYKVDADWQRRVHRWQARLDPLNALTQPVEPPSHILASVVARINGTRSSGNTDAMQSIETTESAEGIESAETTESAEYIKSSDSTERTESTKTIEDVEYALEAAMESTPAATPASAVLESDSLPATAGPVLREARRASDNYEKSASDDVSISVLKERARYWKLATMVAGASLIGVLFLAPRYFEERQSAGNTVRTVAVLQGESNDPIWAVSYQMNARLDQAAEGPHGTLSVTAVGDPQATAEQDHQLWMVLPEGAGVRSVGLVPDTLGETVTLDLPIALAEADELAVSLESHGGVLGPEHGSVVARNFIVKIPE